MRNSEVTSNIFYTKTISRQVIKVSFSVRIYVCAYQHLKPDPMAKKVPKEPPPCSMTLPTVFTNSFPRKPPLKTKKKNKMMAT